MGGGRLGGRTLAGALAGGAMVGGFPGQRAVFAAIDAANQNKQNRKYERKQAKAHYDAIHPNWRAERALYIKPRPKVPTRSKATAALYKQMRSLSLANPLCAPFGLSAAERADYSKLRAVADKLGIPHPGASPAAAPRSEAARMVRKAAKKAEKRAIAEQLFAAAEADLLAESKAAEAAAADYLAEFGVE